MPVYIFHPTMNNLPLHIEEGREKRTLASLLALCQGSFISLFFFFFFKGRKEMSTFGHV